MISRIGSLHLGFFVLALVTSGFAAESTGLALVRHAPSINGTIDGSVQQMLPESVTFNGGAVVTGDLLVPGTPTVRLNGRPAFGGTIDGTGSAAPSNYQVTLNGNARLGHVIRRTTPVALPGVSAPPSPSGNRNVVINSPGQSAGNFATLRNFTLNGNVGQFAIPPGTYGDFTANGGSGFTLGTAGATQPVVYNFQRLTLNGQTQVQILGPVIVNVANGFSANGALGSSANPSRLTLNVYSGGFTLNGGCSVYGYVNAPNGTVIINGNSQLIGGVAADRLTINGGGLLRAQAPIASNQAPVANSASFTVNEDATAAITLTATDGDGQALTYVVVTSPQHGTFSGTAPALTYTPAANYAGSDAFTFKASDGLAESNVATISIVVAPVPDAPVAEAKSLQLDEDTPVSVVLSGTDADGDALTFSVVGQPQHGSLTGSGSTRTYSPSANYSGSDSFTYVANDGSQNSAPATVSVTVHPLPDRPVALAAAYSVNEGDTVAITLTGTDADGDGLTFTRLTAPSNGTLTGTAPNFTYQPNPNFDGTDSFTFTASDGALTSDPATITIRAVDQNFRPVAQGGAVQTDEDVAKTIALSATDQDGDAVTFTIVSGPTKGSLGPVIAGAGNSATVQYTPNANVSGSDAFTFKANDGKADSDVASVTIAIVPVNDAPLADSQSVSSDEDTSVTIVLAGSDVENAPLTFAIVTPPAEGSLGPVTSTGGQTATVAYTPAADGTGMFSFTFKANDGESDSVAATVTLNIRPINDAPVASADAIETAEDTTQTIVLQATDVDSTDVTFAIATPATHGTLGPITPTSALSATVAYTPAANFHGADSLTFTAHDGELGSAPVAVGIAVTSVNDAPVAIDQSVAFPETAGGTLTLGATDADNDALTFAYTQPAHGTLTGAAPNLTYTPAPNYVGPDSFTFKASDPAPLESSIATISITLFDVNTPPVASNQAFELDEDGSHTFAPAVANADNDALTYTVLVLPAHGALTGVPPVPTAALPSITYTPTANFHGADSLTYRVNDGSLEGAEATVSFVVRPINDAPVAVSNSVTTPEDSAVAIGLTATDVDDATLSYEIVTSPQHGVLAPNGGANFTYQPANHFFGSDSFTFRARDGAGMESAAATVSLSVTPVNDAPVTSGQSLTVNRDSNLAVTLSAVDVDGDAIGFIIVAPPQHGTLTGTIPNLTYVPSDGFVGSDRFTFKASDGQSETDVFSVEIDVIVPALPPTVDAGPDQVVRYSAASVGRPRGKIVINNDEWTFTDTAFNPASPTLFNSTTTFLSNLTHWITGGRPGRFLAYANVVPGSVEFVYTQSQLAQQMAALGHQWTVSFAPTLTLADMLKYDGVFLAANIVDSHALVAYVEAGGAVYVSSGTRWSGDIPNEGQIWWNTFLSHFGLAYGTGYNGVAGAIFVPPTDHPLLQGVEQLHNGNGNPVVVLNANNPDTQMVWAAASNPLMAAYGGGNTNHFFLSGSATDDNPPPGGLTYQWTLVRGPAAVDIESPSSAITRVRFGTKGEHVFRLTASDGTESAFDELTVMVHEPPTVHAGADQHVLNSGEAATLQGTASDDGLPGALSYEWSVVGGPGAVSFLDPTNRTTTANFSAPGIYTLRFAANDGMFGVYDHMEVRVASISSVRPAGLIAWWPGNFAPDEQIGGRHALPGKGMSYVAGHVGGAFRFDGVDDYFRVRAHPDIDLGAQPALSVEFWIKPEIDRIQTIFEWASLSGARGVAVTQSIFQGSRRIGLELTDKSGVRHDAHVDNFFELGVWQHVVFTYEKSNGRLRVYRNGQLRGEQSIGSFDPQTGFDLFGGGRMPQLGGSFFQGELDELSFYTRALTPGEAYGLFAAGADGKMPVSANAAPVVSAGSDQAVRNAGQLATIVGSATDDGLPFQGMLVPTWRQLSGPSVALIDSPDAFSTSVTCSVAGIYVFELAVSDGAAVGRDTVEVRVDTTYRDLRPADLVAWWPGNDTTADVVGGLDAMWFNGSNYTNGKVANAFGFSGGHKVQVNASPTLNAETWAGLSIEFWARPSGMSTSGGPTILEWRAPSGATGVKLGIWYFFGYNFEIDLKDTVGGSHAFRVDGAFAMDSWQHFVVSYDRGSGVARVYRNGRLAYESVVGKFVPQIGYDLYWGNITDGLYRGALDEISIYRRALTSEEAFRLYSAESGKFPSGENMPPLVSAGADVIRRSTADAAALLGSVSDDGFPSGNALEVSWSKVSGSGDVDFADPSQRQTTATFSAPGIYVLKLSADDGLAVISDTVTVKVGPFSSVATPADIVAFWPGNDAPTEIMAGRDGVWVNDPAYATGKVGAAFLFDASRKVRVPASPAFDATGWDGLTVEFWVRPRGMDALNGEYPFLQWRNAAGTTGAIVGLSYFFGWNFYANLKDTAGQHHSFNYNGAIQQDVWQHMAVTYDRASGIGRIFRNGSLAVSSNLGSFTPATNYDLEWGNLANSRFAGLIDELTIYRRSLTASEVAGIFAADASGKVAPSDNISPSVNAGPDQLHAGAPVTVNLSGTVLDDNKPFGPPDLTWIKLSGPANGTVTFANQNAANTTATFDTNGTYQLQLTANDHYTASVSDTVVVRLGGATVEPPYGIAAWWPADGHPREVVRGGHDVVFGGAAAYAPGKVAEGISFTGSGFARVDGHADLDIGASPAGFTIEFWVRRDTLAEGPLLAWNNAGTYGLYVWTNNGGRNAYIDLIDTNGGAHVVEPGVALLSVGEWTHLAFTYDRPTGWVRLYGNGRLVKEQNVGSFAARTVPSYPLWIASNQGVTPFRGVLDELSLYTRPLTSAEVVAIHDAGAEGKSAPGMNSAPVVDAGADVVLRDTAAVATLNGQVSDIDQQPFGAPVATWSVVTHPIGAQVQFGDQNLAATTAMFSLPGTYLLKLTGSDRFAAPVSDLVEVRVGVEPVTTVPGITAWWNGNGHPREMVSGQANMEVMNGATYATARVLQGFQLDGANSFVRALSHPDIDLGSSQAGFTVELWVKRENMGDGPLFAWHTGAALGVYVWTSNNGQSAYFDIVDTSGASHIVSLSTSPLLVGQWAHLAFVYDRAAGVARAYVNGALNREQNVGVFTPRTGPGFAFWLGSYPTNRTFKGIIDEPALYRRPLSATEIGAIFDSGTAGKTLPAPNSAPIVDAGPDVSAPVGLDVALAGAATDDGLPNPPGALTYAWSKISGPGEIVFSAPHALNTAAAFNVAGTYAVRLTVSDSELTGMDDLIVSVSAPPVIEFAEPHNGSSLPNSTAFDLLVRATDTDGTIAKVEFFQGATKLGEQAAPLASDPSVYFWQLSSGLPNGSYTYTARATDNTGLSTTSAPIGITVIDDPGPPVAEFSAPAEDARIAKPTEVSGFVSSSLLASWKLERRLKATEGAPAEAWTSFSAGTTSIGSQGSPATLGSFDPTSLINGIYELRLSATDTAGRTTIAGPSTLLVEGNMKIGAFALAFEDLKLPVAGIPITITRTYDSRDARVGDFGPGWRIAVNNVRVQKNRTLGRGWFQTQQSGDGLQFYYVEPQQERIVTVTMPDGETHRFRGGAVVKNRPGDPDNASFATVAREGTFKFYPLGDTTSTLEPLDASNQLYHQIWLNGTGEQDLYAGEFGDLDFIDYNATRFRLTTADGTVFILDEALGLLEMRDLNGNTLLLDRDGNNRVTGITSTLNTQPSTLSYSITIHRDATGRVDYIRDPDNRDLDYLYDAQGRLESFTDRESNVTQFRYENAAFPHYLTKTIDPRGITALRSEYDANGKLIKQIDADGNETVFDRGIDSSGRFEKMKDRLGHETTFYYDERGNVTLKIDPLGAQTSYSYYPDSDRVKFETDHYGNVKSAVYDARGNVLMQTLGANTTEDPANPTTGFTTRTTYNVQSAPTQMTDPDGRVQSFTYDETTNNLLTHTVGVGGTAPAATSYTYNADGTLATITDALGNVTSHTYDYAFSSTAFPAAVKQSTVRVSQLSTLDSQLIPLRTTRTLFDAQENQLAQIVTRTLPDGGTEDVVTRYLYDAENRLRATVMPDGRVTETRYTSFGKEEKSVLWRTLADYESGNDALARITTYGYDARGNQTSVTYADGTTERMSFDLENRKEWSQDRRGYRTFFVYDPVGRLRFTIQPDNDDMSGTGVPPVDVSDPRLANNPRSETQYDLIGRVRFQIDERGAKTEFTYEDGCGCAMRRKEMIQHLTSGNLVTSYIYDQAGNVRFVTDPRGNVTETRYDDQGRPTRVVYPATDEHPSTETETIYDLVGHRVALIDQEGKTTRYRYDALGRLVEVRQYLDAATAAADSDFSLLATHSSLLATSYSYDELGSQIAQTDALGRVTRYEPDALGRRTKRILPKEPSEATFLTETLAYDEWGNLWQRTDFAGKTTTFTYDALNRLKSKTADATHPSLGYSHATARIEYDYDANGARIAARTFNGSDLALYAESTPRDERGRISEKSLVSGPLSPVTLSYSYYGNNLLKDVVSSNSGGVNVGYRYDEQNRLESVDDTSTGLPTRTTGYAYNANGSLETVAQPNGVVHTYGYDGLNRLRGLIVSRGTTLLHSYEYKLRASGHRRQVVEGARTITYNYDELYRLRGESRVGDANGNNGDVTYDLDKVGNRLARVSQLSTLNSQLNQTYNARDWLDGDTYNPDGSTLTSSQFSTLNPQLAGTDTYDFEERLIVRTKPDGTSINIAYDADGHRIAKNILDPVAQPGSSTTWLVDTNNLTGYAQVFEERTTVGGSTPSSTFRTYTYGTDLISQAEASSLAPSTFTLRYYVADGHGSTRELTDATGAITDRYDYDAFGNLVHQTGTTANMYRYAGEQYDPDLGLYYNRARYLNTDSGRFWSMDSYEGSSDDPIGLHKYLYASANPVSGRDPSGNMTIAEPMMTVGVVGILQKIAVVSLVATLVEMPFRGWTIWAGAETTSLHAYFVARHRDGRTYRYDVSVSSRVAVLAPQNPFKKYEARMVESYLPASEALTGVRAPVGRLSETTYRFWVAQIPRGPIEYVYAYKNCFTYSLLFEAKAALLTLLPF